jgi:hypothetical protein
MTDHPDGSSVFVSCPGRPRSLRGNLKAALAMFTLLAAALLLAPHSSAQNAPHVSGVDPASGKVSDNVTVSGDNLGKESVVGVFLSDDKSDYKATLVNQATDKIVVKIPEVKAGDYNISIQVGDKILILPVKFKVEG